MFGFHVNRDWRKGAPLPANIGTALVDIEQRGVKNVKSVQVFMSSPREQNLKFTDADAEALSRCLEDRGLWGVAHATYLDRPWPGSKNPAFSQKFIRSELRMADKAGLHGLVVHLQTESPEETASVLDTLVVPECQVKVYLETPHVRPEVSHYETPEKLKVLYDLIKERNLEKHFGLCIDTAHLWACGVDISSFEDGSAWIAALEASGIPASCLLFHLNDSCKQCGGGVDHHAPLAEGNIWGAYAHNLKDSGLAAFVDFIERHDLPCILERSNTKKKGQPPKAELLNDFTVLRSLGADV